MSSGTRLRTGAHDGYRIPRDKMVRAVEAAGIRDRRVLDAMREMPRHLFLTEPLWTKAYTDATLPIGSKQTMTQPTTTARMLEALKLNGSERVLEIGTGSGYQTALLGVLARAVFSVERVAGLARDAQDHLRKLHFPNVSVKHFDGTYGWKEYAPYDAIVVSATAPAVPPPLIEQLAPEGRMVIPLASGAGEEICIVTRGRSGAHEVTGIAPCTFVRLVGRFGYRGE